VAPVTVPVFADRAGYVARIDGRAVGLAVVGMGGGRTRPDQGIDPRVGFTAFAGLGESVDGERPICRVHAADDAMAARAAAAVRAAVTIDDTAPVVPGPVLERVA
jgi:thymidine phosphorylase